MPVIIHIETSTNACSVAVSVDSKIIFEKISTEGPSHATLLGVFVSEAMQALRQMAIEPDAVSVSSGPGSYTGLRIGVSEAKGLCYGLNIPLIALKTPLIMAKTVIGTLDIDDNTLLCPMIDARRMEVYAAIYDKNLNTVRDINADIITPDSYAEYLSDSKILFFGNGSDKCKGIINSANANFVEDIFPSASNMVELAEAAYKNNDFADTAYFEPFYLKDFVATTPKNQILGH